MPLAPLFEEFQKRWVRPRVGRTLIVGSKIYKTREDRRRLYPGEVIGVDMLPGDGVDRVLDLEEPLPDDMGTFEHIECLSVLEHSKRPIALAKNLCKLLRPNATFFFTVPFMWRVHAYPDDYWRFTLQNVRSLFPNVEWVKLCYVHKDFSEDRTIPQVIVDDHIYFIRTEVYGFGSAR